MCMALQITGKCVVPPCGIGYSPHIGFLQLRDHRPYRVRRSRPVDMHSVEHI